MIADDPVIRELAEANPIPGAAEPDSHERAQADRVLARVLSAPPPRSHRLRSAIVPALTVVLVLAVGAVFLRTTTSNHSGTSGPGAAGGFRVTLQAQPTPQTPMVTTAAMTREIALLRERLGAVLSQVHVTRSGANQIVVAAPDVSPGRRAQILKLATTMAHLTFYDWEANALAPNGKTVASQLPARNPAALAISQGSNRGPGAPGAGSLGLYRAVTLAAKQPALRSSQSLSRLGPEYFMFGAPGSAACTIAATDAGTIPTQAAHCYLAGPAFSTSALHSELPRGVSASEGQMLTVPQGTVVLQAAGSDPTHPVNFDSPSAQFFALKDHPALQGINITNPQASTDPAGAPDVQLGFNAHGAKQFQKATATIAHRGASLSLGSQQLNQHFVAVLDDHILTVPYIDFRQYPDGVITQANSGFDISGGPTTQNARQLATELRYGALPLNLHPISQHPTTASR